MAATPFPTLEQYMALRNKVDGRPSVALREIKRRLESTLLAGSELDIISKTNELEGFTTDDVKIRHPLFIGGAPVRDADGFANCITIGLSATTEFEGSGQMKNEYSLSIYSIDERIETEEQYYRMWDRIGLIKAALFPFMGGCIDEDDRVCWRSLVPMQSGVEWEDWDEYGGIYVFYRMICDPSQNTWSVD